VYLVSDTQIHRFSFLDNDVVGIGFPQRQLVAPHRDLDRIAQGSYLKEGEGTSSGDTHVHDPVHGSAFAIDFLDDNGLAHMGLFKGFHTDSP